MKEKSFTFNPKFCFIDLDYENPKSSCLLDIWSVQHFYWQGFFYIIFHKLFKLKKMRHMVLLLSILTILHAYEDYFGNIGLLSLEGIFIDNVGPLIDPKINISLREKDNDYMDNTIGDILCGFTSNIFILIYIYYYGELPYFYLLGSIIVLYLLYVRRNYLYPK